MNKIKNKLNYKGSLNGFINDLNNKKHFFKIIQKY